VSGETATRRERIGNLRAGANTLSPVAGLTAPLATSARIGVYVVECMMTTTLVGASACS
jgi:hypothetical protein